MPALVSSTGDVGPSLGTGQTMIPGEYLSNNGWRFSIQYDCNLLLYDRSGGVKWSSGTYNDYNGYFCFLKMQDDCNLVLYARSVKRGTSSLWESRTADLSDGGCRLELNARSSLAIIGSPGTVKGVLSSPRKY